jgi:hypothetical protein
MSNSQHPVTTGNHIAGEPEEGVQRCVICGGIIVDNRNAHMQLAPEGQEPCGPLFWKPGPVAVIRDGPATYSGLGHNDDIADCTP